MPPMSKFTVKAVSDGDSHDHDELREKLCSYLCLKLTECIKGIKKNKKRDEDTRYSELFH